MKKILFISHEASRTGAPSVLLSFLKWLRKEKKEELHICVLVLRTGSLSGEFKINSDEFYELPKKEEVPQKFYPFLKKKIIKKMGKTLLSPEDFIIKHLRDRKFDLIYANSVFSIPTASKIKDFDEQIKLIVHIHELETVIKLAVPDLSQYLPIINKFIAVSDLVKNNLIRNYNVNKDRIQKIYESSINLDSINKQSNKDIFVVGAAGTTDWRKGCDLFLQIAYYLKKIRPDCEINYIWIGKMTYSQKEVINGDIIKSGLKGVVNFIGEKDNLKEFFDAIDIFLLPSREDPFPLVAIEAGMSYKPIICFEGATGITEVLINGGGKIIPYLDVQKMGEAVIDYYDMPETLEIDGNRANELFSHFTPENMAPRIYKLLERLLEEPSVN